MATQYLLELRIRGQAVRTRPGRSNMRKLAITGIGHEKIMHAVMKASSTLHHRRQLVIDPRATMSTSCHSAPRFPGRSGRRADPICQDSWR